MVYIRAKKDKIAKDGSVIKGIDLYVHVNSVLQSALAINEAGHYQKDPAILRYFAIVHDLGKANPLFQSNMMGETSSRDNVLRHEISSVLFIDIVPAEIRDIVALLVLSHHKSIADDDRGLQDICDIGNCGFARANEKLWNHIDGIEEWGKPVVEFLKEHFDIDATIPSIDRCEKILTRYAKMKLERGYSEYRGICMSADHIASAFEDDKEREEAMSRLYKVPNFSVYNSKNELYPLSLIDSDTSKRHTFCTAPCGSGKTNFMLKRCTKRVFYVLPYQASINAMSQRIQKDITNEYKVGVKHASYNSLSFIDDVTKSLSSLFGLPVKVTTPFQILPILFGLKGYEGIIMDIKGQDVILDEIHTYGGKSMTCVLILIQVLKNIGCNIHICTATMPTALKRRIIDILGEVDTQIVELSSDALSTYDRHIVHTLEKDDWAEIRRRYGNNEKILIVRNQINRAAETYRQIKMLFPQAKSMLIHSCFERGDRIELERRLLSDFNAKNEPCIVVSTQVIEVSLDISFDVMFTDCADIMSLIQRFGRVNRQRTADKTYKDIYVIESNIFSPRECLPYELSVCNRTFQVFKSIDGQILKENDLQQMIDSVYPTFTPDTYDRAWPYDENGRWRFKIYSHIPNESVAKNLEFQGFIGIRESNVDLYRATKDNRLEIPLSTEKKTNGLKEDKEGKFFIIPDALYDKEYGFINPNR